MISLNTFINMFGGDPRIENATKNYAEIIAPGVTVHTTFYPPPPSPQSIMKRFTDHLTSHAKFDHKMIITQAELKHFIWSPFTVSIPLLPLFGPFLPLLVPFYR